MTHEVTRHVTGADTAAALGSGEVDVLATPRLIAWLEAATVELARPELGADRTTVGTAVRVQHRRPTPVGGTVTVTAELVEGPGEKGQLRFSVGAVDGDGKRVADGEIDRAVVERTGVFAG